MMKLYPVFWVITACYLTACTAITTDNLLFMVIPDRADNRMTATVVDHTVVLDLHSASGIGHATVQWVGSDYPDRILLRLHLRGLEELRVAYATTVITLSIPSTGEFAVRQYYAPAGPEPRQAQVITPDSPYWMKTTVVAQTPPGQNPIPLTDGWVEIELPPHFLQARYTGFVIQWIDFYR